MRTGWFLSVVVGVLALADGIIHLSLDFILFHGRFFGTGFPGGAPSVAPRVPTPPPSGAPPQLPLPLNELFLLNFVGYVALVSLFWFSPRLFGQSRWVLNLALIVYVFATIAGWLVMGRPNPMGLGYLSKGIEVVLIVALVAHAWTALRGGSAEDLAA